MLGAPSWFSVWLFFTLSTLIPVNRVTSSLSLTDTEKPVPVSHVNGLQGTTAVLPCDVQSPSGWGDVFLILWFKDNATKPMYSLDVLGRPLSSASQWADTTSLGRRSTFRTSTPTALLIDAVTPEDEGLYRCRVDYKNSPTKNVKIQFSVIVPPHKPVITWRGNKVTAGAGVGPYHVGDTLVVTCEVSGGSPAPSVIWWKEGSVYDDTYELVSSKEKMVTNTLRYQQLSREDAAAKFTCQASNTKQTHPVATDTHVILNLPPTDLEILEKPTYVSQGRPRVVTCQAMGGFPSPEITWWIGTRRLKPEKTKKEYQGVATSKLVYKPDINDDGRYLACRVLPTSKTGKSLEDTWEIKVLYAPQVSLRLGASLDPDNLRTGNDVYFECDVRANPIPHKLIWLHNGVELSQDQGAGIVMSTQSLVLQKVSRKSGGEYQCQAVNSEGTDTSAPLTLNIMYAPTCKSGSTPRLLGISFKSASKIVCEVEAYPAAVSFRWFFNSSEYEEWKGHEEFSQTGLKSELQFLPKTSKDYGTLFCIGENAIGRQEEACVFQIVPTGKPSPLTGCQIVNKTLTSLKVQCQEGFDGGLPANFLLELYHAEKMELKSQVTNKVPIFEVSHIDPGVPIKLLLYAENAKGTSDPAVIDDALSSQHKHYVEGVTDFKAVKDNSRAEGSFEASFDPSFYLLVAGAAFACTITIVAICVVATFRRKRQGSQSIATIPTSSSDSSAAQNHFGSNPDLIPDKTNVEPGGCLSDLDSSLLLNSGGLPTGPIEHSSLSRRPQKVAMPVAPGCSDQRGISTGSHQAQPLQGAATCFQGGLEQSVAGHQPHGVHANSQGEHQSCRNLDEQYRFRSPQAQFRNSYMGVGWVGGAQQVHGYESGLRTEFEVVGRASTLDRRGARGAQEQEQEQGLSSESMYHTCTRRPQSLKKKVVTIRENKDAESEV